MLLKENNSRAEMGPKKESLDANLDESCSLTRGRLIQGPGTRNIGSDTWCCSETVIVICSRTLFMSYTNILGIGPILMG